MMASFFVPGGAANSGWTSYPPLSDIATQGQTWWLVGMSTFMAASSTTGVFGGETVALGPVLVFVVCVDAGQTPQSRTPQSLLTMNPDGQRRTRTHASPLRARVIS